MGDKGETNYFCYLRDSCPGWKEKICDHDIQIHTFFFSGIQAPMCTKCGYQPLSYEELTK
jgi:hypothetical protein